MEFLTEVAMWKSKVGFTFKLRVTTKTVINHFRTVNFFLIVNKITKKLILSEIKRSHS